MTIELKNACIERRARPDPDRDGVSCGQHASVGIAGRAGPRDEIPPPLTGIAGRLDRARSKTS